MSLQSKGEESEDGICVPGELKKCTILFRIGSLHVDSCIFVIAMAMSCVVM